jgi:hypothetical protein
LKSCEWIDFLRSSDASDKQKLRDFISCNRREGNKKKTWNKVGLPVVSLVFLGISPFTIVLA